MQAQLTMLNDEHASPDRAGRHERERDAHRVMRDAILCKLTDAGRPMRPKELSDQLGVPAFAVSLAVTRWPTYFEIEHGNTRGGRGIKTIDQHRHLRTPVPW